MHLLTFKWKSMYLHMEHIFKVRENQVEVINAEMCAGANDIIKMKGFFDVKEIIELMIACHAKGA